MHQMVAAPAAPAAPVRHATTAYVKTSVHLRHVLILGCSAAHGPTAAEEPLHAEHASMVHVTPVYAYAHLLPQMIAEAMNAALMMTAAEAHIPAAPAKIRMVQHHAPAANAVQYATQDGVTATATESTAARQTCQLPTTAAPVEIPVHQVHTHA